jgi:hypothetical protein
MILQILYRFIILYSCTKEIAKEESLSFVLGKIIMYCETTFVFLNI